ncbi:MAG: DEAD/DEAH box helicase [Candidatus Melainabacteria bacterium]|nr:DEAD/DEAH box helicase [Candidatus Melainabacteria bacterium]OPZ90686.1 MAG: ATP-dependent RNA helicase RhlE [bacterium ADurb.Bin425]
MISFSELGLSKPVVAALSELGYEYPTEIQAGTAQYILSGLDVMASAQTGSGKTGAFALPVIECLDEPDEQPRCLVLTPTRELALQVEEEFRKFCKYKKLKTATVYGGTAFAKQIAALKKPVDVIVATPGRLLDCVEHKYVNLSKVEILILDEADRLLDLGFMPQLRKIISKLPKDRQTLMFSATLEGKVAAIASDYMQNPVTVRVNTERLDVESIDQRFVHVKEYDKDEKLIELLSAIQSDKDIEIAKSAAAKEAKSKKASKDDEPDEVELRTDSVLIFTGTKRKASWVKDRLRDAGIKAEEIHSDISQAKRESTLKRYRAGSFNVLVATDVAARGLDIPFIGHVFNYDLPELAEDYIHRIGRTGRAGRSGVATTFVSDEQKHLLASIENIIGIKKEKPKLSMAKQAALKRFHSRRR